MNTTPPSPTTQLLYLAGGEALVTKLRTVFKEELLTPSIIPYLDKDDWESLPIRVRVGERVSLRKAAQELIQHLPDERHNSSPASQPLFFVPAEASLDTGSHTNRNTIPANQTPPKRKLESSTTENMPPQDGSHNTSLPCRSSFSEPTNITSDSEDDSVMAGMNDSEDDEDFQHDNSEGKRTPVPNDRPFHITVQGAGNPAVNGVYSQDGLFSNACRYAKQGHWNSNDYTFFIFQCQVSDNTRHWYISIVPYSGDPGTGSDIDFYSAPVTEECKHIPPRVGWVLSDEGKDPSPSLEFLYVPQ